LRAKRVTEVVYPLTTVEQDRARLLENFYRLGGPGASVEWFDSHVTALLAIHHSEFRVDFTARFNRGDFQAA
jgi:hypothetical protein